MSTWHKWPLVFLLLVSLAGCSSLPFGLGDAFPSSTHTPEATFIPASSTPAGPTVFPAPAEESVTPTQPASEQKMRLWLPPQFDPDGTNPASVLLKQRLDEFVKENPTVSLDVRVKTLDGPGGMLDSLVAANAAAPQALPDLILLSRPLLESAAVKGLLHPYDGLTDIMLETNWFDYSLQLAHLKENTYGIPFAGNVMVLAYSGSMMETQPLSLQDVLTQQNALLFPASDPQALFAICEYLAVGGRVQDDQGRPSLEEGSLVNLLDYFQQASQAQVMPITLTQFTDDNQVWAALLSGQYPMGVTWTGTYLDDADVDQSGLEIAPLPTPDGSPFSLASGWSWGLAGQDPGRQALSVKMVEFLVDPEFLGEWNLAAGLLPPRADALETWPVRLPVQVLEQVSYSAWLVPSADVVSTIGPVLQRAVIDVLEGRNNAPSAAHAAVEQVNYP
jgi:ABC-type glycerol-3-phosphate transport system substrate-binding protein